MNKCKMLKEMKERIDNGEDPDAVIPYHINVDDPDAAREICYYALQVLPDGRRKETLKKYWEEHYARRSKNII